MEVFKGTTSRSAGRVRGTDGVRSLLILVSHRAGNSDTRKAWSTKRWEMKLPPASRGKAAAGLSLGARVLEEGDARRMGGWGRQAGSLRKVNGGKYASEMLGEIELQRGEGMSPSSHGKRQLLIPQLYLSSRKPSTLSQRSCGPAGRSEPEITSGEQGAPHLTAR